MSAAKAMTMKMGMSAEAETIMFEGCRDLV